MPADYNGTWEMVSNDKFEDIMKAIGKWSFYRLYENKVFLPVCLRAAEGEDRRGGCRRIGERE